MFTQIDRTLTGPPLPTGSELALMALFALLFELNRAQSSALVNFAKFGFVSKPDLHAAITPDGKPKSDIGIVGVTVHAARQKLKPFGITIDTIWGAGYRLGEESRNRLRELVRAHGEDIVTATTPVSPTDRKKARLIAA